MRALIFRAILNVSLPVFALIGLTSLAHAEPWDIVCRQDGSVGKSPAKSVSLEPQGSGIYKAFCIHENGEKREKGKISCGPNRTASVAATKNNMDGANGNVLHNLVVCNTPAPIAMN